MLEKKCKICSKIIIVKPSRYERTKYCSKICAMKGWAGQRRSIATEFKKGQGKGKHPPNYINGPILSRGYVLIRQPNHPRAHPTNGRIPEHIWIWEKYHGKYLPEGYIVHHINGIKNDNRIENLVAMSRKNHHPALDPEIIKVRLRKVESQLAESECKYEKLLSRIRDS